MPKLKEAQYINYHSLSLFPFGLLKPTDKLFDSATRVTFNGGNMSFVTFSAFDAKPKVANTTAH